MIIEELRSIARAADMPFGYGNSTRMREFFADGGGIFCLYVPFGGIPGQETWQVFVRGAGAAAAVKMIEDGMGRGGSLNITRTADGYRVDISRSIRVPFSSGGPRIEPVVTADYLYFEAVDAGAVVSAIAYGTPLPDINYSTDGGATWNAWQHTTGDNGNEIYDNITLGAVGDKVWFKGVNAAFTDAEQTYGFGFDLNNGNVNAGGSVTSILDGDGVTLTAIPDYGFGALFMGCANLVIPPTFGNVTSIGDYGCAGMYMFNTSLTTAADMSGVTSIGDHGCENMHGQCTSLTAAADMSGVTSIGVSGCEGMYSGQNSLTAAADMGNVATFGQDACEHMYRGNNSVTLVDDGALTFAFPTLPVTAGTDTFTTAQEVADWMTT